MIFLYILAVIFCFAILFFFVFAILKHFNKAYEKYYLMGIEAFQRGELSLSKEYLDLALKNNKNSVALKISTYVALGSLYFKLKEIESALYNIDMALSIISSSNEFQSYKPMLEKIRSEYLDESSNSVILS